jgi:hypothetical protein
MGNESSSALRFNAIGREALSSSTEPLNMFHVEYGDMNRRFPHAPETTLIFIFPRNKISEAVQITKCSKNFSSEILRQNSHLELT